MAAWRNCETSKLASDVNKQIQSGPRGSAFACRSSGVCSVVCGCSACLTQVGISGRCRACRGLGDFGRALLFLGVLAASSSDCKVSWAEAQLPVRHR